MNECAYKTQNLMQKSFDCAKLWKGIRVQLIGRSHQMQNIKVSHCNKFILWISVHCPSKMLQIM